MVLLQQALGVDHVLETLLGFEAGSGEDAAVKIPEAEALQVGGAALIVQNEGNDAVAQALLEHQKSSDPTIPVIKGADALKAHVEVQDLQQSHFLQMLILTQKLAHLGIDILGCRGFQLAQIVGCGAVRPDAALATALGEGAVEHQIVKPLDVGLGQRLGGGVNDVIHAEHVVGGFNEVIYLNWLKAGLDLVRLKDLRDLGEHEPVAGHAPVAEGEVRLNVIKQAMVYLLGLLLPKILD